MGATAEAALRIGIIGWDSNAISLAEGWVGEHRLIVGMPDPDGLCGRAVEQALPRAMLLEVEDASGADLVVLTVPATAVARTAIQMGDLEGRILVDCSWGPEDPHLGEQSGAEALQLLMPNARVVRAVPYEAWTLTNGVHLCGDEDEAVDRVSELFESAGWQVSRIGVLRRARSLKRVHATRHEDGPLHVVS